MSIINKAAVFNPFSDLTSNILDYIPRATTSEFGIVAIGSGINVDNLGRIYLDTQEYSDRLTAIETQAVSSLATQQTAIAEAIAQVNLAQSQTITALTLEVSNLKTNLTDSISATKTDLINRADQLAQEVADITDQLTQDKAAFTQEIQDALDYLKDDASVASALRTPRKIQGVDFDGTQDISLPIFTAQTDGLVPKRVGTTTTKYLREDGTWVSPPDTTYPLLTEAIAEGGTATNANTISAKVLKDAIQYHAPPVTSITGNAGTATKLQTPRAINGVGFDGSVNITLPLASTSVSGTVQLNNTLTSTNTGHALTAAQGKVLNESKLGKSENAVSASKLATARMISLTGGVTGSVSFDGSANASITTTITGLGAANGIATLDSNGQVPSTQLPSYVDDVLEYLNVAAFPATGETGKIYVETAGNTTYRWSGSAYVKITSGEVTSVAGKIGVVTITKADVGLANVDNTSDLNKPVSLATVALIEAAQDKMKRGIANRYDSSLAYNAGELVVLANGAIVKSTISGNTNNPNVDMAGWRKPNDLTGNPLMFGAKGDGVFDDTLAIQECANKFRYLDMRNGNWKTTGKITLRSGTVVDLRGSYLSANNANEPIFEFENAGDGLSILGGGGYVYGTADSFLKCSGKTYQPTMQTDYARQIRLDGVHVTGVNIDKFLDFDKAVRQVFMTKVFAYVKNGMFCNGKCVEIEIYGSIIYGGLGVSDLSTFGIKYVSPGGGRWYNEGLHITDSTIDNFGTTFDIRDIYAMSVTGGHIGAAIQADGHNAPGALVAKFGQPTSSACRNIKFANVNIYGNIEFAPVGGLDYQAKFTGCTSEMCNGANIFIKNNASSITVSNHAFHSSTNGVAVVCQSNNFNISVNDITCDQTFIGGVHIRSAIGDNVSVRDINYAGSGDAVYCERPILISGVPVATTGMANYKRKLVNAPQSTYAVSQTIATVSAGFAKGETGEIVVELSYSGATPTNQILKINIPGGLVVPNGSGWSSEFVVLKSETGTISARISYFVTKSIASADIALVNFEGSALTLGYHGYFGVQRDW